jgi:hypothetical protein
MLDWEVVKEWELVIPADLERQQASSTMLFLIPKNNCKQLRILFQFQEKCSSSQFTLQSIPSFVPPPDAR